MPAGQAQQCWSILGKIGIKWLGNNHLLFRDLNYTIKNVQVIIQSYNIGYPLLAPAHPLIYPFLSVLTTYVESFILYMG